MNPQDILLSLLVGLWFLAAIYAIWANSQANQHLELMKHRGVYSQWAKQNRLMVALPIIMLAGILLAGLSFVSFIYIGLAPSSGNAELVPFTIAGGLVGVLPILAIARYWLIKRAKPPTGHTPTSDRT